MEVVGSDKDNASTLFGSYHQYCQRTGSRAKGSREFSPSLLDLCNHILGWANVQKVCRNVGKFIKGLRLRTDADTHIPNPIEALSAQVTGTVTGQNPCCVRKVTGVTGQTNSIRSLNLIKKFQQQQKFLKILQR
jgi:hypothetical protein